MNLMPFTVKLIATILTYSFNDSLNVHYTCEDVQCLMLSAHTVDIRLT